MGKTGGGPGTNQYKIRGQSGLSRVVLPAFAPEDVSPERRRIMGKQLGLPPEFLIRMSYDSDSEVREAVAGNPETDSATFQRLARDKVADVREAVAGNVACPPDVLRFLSSDPASKVAWTVAKNPATPQDVLRALIYYGLGMRANVAANTACPPDLLLRLLDDEDEMVVMSAKSNIEVLPPHLRTIAGI